MEIDYKCENLQQWLSLSIYCNFMMLLTIIDSSAPGGRADFWKPSIRKPIRDGDGLDVTPEHIQENRRLDHKSLVFRVS